MVFQQTNIRCGKQLLSLGWIFEDGKGSRAYFQEILD